MCLKFLKEYYNHECLWNPNDPNYKKVKVTDKAFLKLGEICDADNVKTVKYKIKCLRNLYINEIIKIKASQKLIEQGKSSSLYEPNLPWFRFAKTFLDVVPCGKRKRTTETPAVVKKEKLDVIDIESDEEDLKTIENPNSNKLLATNEIPSNKLPVANPALSLQPPATRIQSSSVNQTKDLQLLDTNQQIRTEQLSTTNPNQNHLSQPSSSSKIIINCTSSKPATSQSLIAIKTESKKLVVSNYIPNNSSSKSNENVKNSSLTSNRLTAQVIQCPSHFNKQQPPTANNPVSNNNQLPSSNHPKIISSQTIIASNEQSKFSNFTKSKSKTITTKTISSSKQIITANAPQLIISPPPIASTSQTASSQPIVVMTTTTATSNSQKPSITLNRVINNNSTVTQKLLNVKGVKCQSVAPLNVNSNTVNSDDELFAFGQSVVSQMRNLPEEQRIELMSEIQASISTKRLKYLRDKILSS